MRTHGHTLRQQTSKKWEKDVFKFLNVFFCLLKNEMKIGIFLCLCLYFRKQKNKKQKKTQVVIIFSVIIYCFGACQGWKRLPKPEYRIVKIETTEPAPATEYTKLLKISVPTQK